MLKTNIKLTLLSSIIFFQISSSAFSMEILEENKNNFSISIKPKNENLSIEVPIGSIVAFAGDKEPNGWLMCDGKPYNRYKYNKLYEVIGKKYTNIKINITINDNSSINKNIPLSEGLSNLEDDLFVSQTLEGAYL